MTEIVPPKYDKVENFHDGLAAVGMIAGRGNGPDDIIYNWGFIDATGKEVVPCKYESRSAPEFHEGLAAVWVDTGEKDRWDNTIYKWGYIDATGKEVIPCEYGIANDFSEGLAWVEVDTSEKQLWDGYPKSTWSNGEWVTTEYIWCYTTNGVNANLPDQSKEETQQIIEQSNKLLEEEKPLEERLAELAMENPTLSGWAKNEVVAAIKANLVPADLMDGYNTNITRQEFCSLMVMMLEQATGKKALDYIAEKGLTYQSPFTDTNLPTVGYAYTLGIVKGTGDTTFNPNGSITRQEAATMLGRAGRLLGLEAKSSKYFTDRQDFPSWAVEGIAYVSGLTDPVSQKKVMEGTGGGFSPKGTYTREQGIITALRLFRCGD